MNRQMQINVNDNINRNEPCSSQHLKQPQQRPKQQQQEPSCKICLEQIKQTQIFTACNCKQSNSHVHQTCLLQWAKKTPKYKQFPDKYYFNCQICKQKIYLKVEKQIKLISYERIPFCDRELFCTISTILIFILGTGMLGAAVFISYTSKSQADISLLCNVAIAISSVIIVSDLVISFFYFFVYTQINVRGISKKRGQEPQELQKAKQKKPLIKRKNQVMNSMVLQNQVTLQNLVTNEGINQTQMAINQTLPKVSIIKVFQQQNSTNVGNINSNSIIYNSQANQNRKKTNQKIGRQNIVGIQYQRLSKMQNHKPQKDQQVKQKQIQQQINESLKIEKEKITQQKKQQILTTPKKKNNNKNNNNTSKQQQFHQDQQQTLDKNYQINKIQQQNNQQNTEGNNQKTSVCDNVFIQDQLTMKKIIYDSKDQQQPSITQQGTPYIFNKQSIVPPTPSLIFEEKQQQSPTANISLRYMKKRQQFTPTSYQLKQQQQLCQQQQSTQRRHRVISKSCNNIQTSKKISINKKREKRFSYLNADGGNESNKDKEKEVGEVQIQKREYGYRSEIVGQQKPVVMEYLTKEVMDVVRNKDVSSTYFNTTEMLRRQDMSLICVQQESGDA